MATKIDHPVRRGSEVGLDHFMNIETDPRGKDVLDPYSIGIYDIHYQIRNSIGVTRTVNKSVAGAPDMISWMEYRTHDYWWILSIINRLIRAEKELITGMSFFIPSLSDLVTYLQNLSRKKNEDKIVKFGVTPGGPVTNKRS